MLVLFVHEVSIQGVYVRGVCVLGGIGPRGKCPGGISSWGKCLGVQFRGGGYVLELSNAKSCKAYILQLIG